MDLSDRISLDEAYMQMAEIWAKRSYATRSKVGAILVMPGEGIISDGYNGMPSGMPNGEVELRQDDGSLVTNKLVLHAESNAILKCAKNGRSSVGSHLYITMSPCIDCVKLIIQAGVKKVFYRTAYRDVSPLEVLNRANIECTQL